MIPTFSPQGDGNTDCVSVKFDGIPVDPYLFPARGRKLKLLRFRRLGIHPLVDPYLFPARGRKLCGVDGHYVIAVPC